VLQTSRLAQLKVNLLLLEIRHLRKQISPPDIVPSIILLSLLVPKKSA